MTTPNQPASDGAYVIGGGGNSYGQEMTDASAAHLMLGGFTSIASIANPLDAVGAAMGMFAESLLKLPLDVLKLFEPLIPGDLGAIFDTVGGAVSSIMGFFQTIGPLLTSTFNSFITTTYNVLSSGFQQILDIVNGLVVVPISSAVSGFKDWFTGLMGSTIPDLGTAITGAVNDVADLVNSLLTAPATVLGAIPQTLVSGLTTALSDVNGFVNGVVNAIVQAISGIPFVGGSIAAAIAALAGAVQTQQVNQQSSVVTLATNGGSRNPSWVCRYPLADVSYPESLNQKLLVEGVTEAQSAGTAHTHLLDVTHVTASPAAWSILQNTSRGVIVTMSNSTVFDTLGLILQCPAGVTSSVHVIPEVFREDSSGGMTRVAALSDVASLIGAGSVYTYVEVTLPTPIIAQAGERYMVLLRNTSTTATTVYMLGLQQSASAQAGGRLFASSASTSSFTSSQMTSSLVSILPWAMLATRQAAPGEHTYTDNFDNRLTMGPLWFPTSNISGKQIKLANNQAAFNGTTAGDQLALYTLPTGGDGMLVEANIYSRSLTSMSGVMLCCNRELTQTVYLGVNQSAMNLYTGAWNALTQRGTWVVSNGNSKWSVVVDPSTGLFTILRDGTAIQTWSSAGTVLFGEDYRYGGLRTSLSALGGSTVAGPMDNFLLRDA